jgi:hypothetical protein
VTDAAGNEATTTTVYLSVPHAQGGSAAVDSGAVAGYTVTP